MEVESTVTLNELNQIRETIENMNKFNQVEVLRILRKHESVTLNENKYGVHVNLTELTDDIIRELLLYIKYVDAQEVTLSEVEQQKEDYWNTYFSSMAKDRVITK